MAHATFKCARRSTRCDGRALRQGSLSAARRIILDLPTLTLPCHSAITCEGAKHRHAQPDHFWSGGPSVPNPCTCSTNCCFAGRGPVPKTRCQCLDKKRLAHMSGHTTENPVFRSMGTRLTGRGVFAPCAEWTGKATTDLIANCPRLSGGSMRLDGLDVLFLTLGGDV